MAEGKHIIINDMSLAEARSAPNPSGHIVRVEDDTEVCDTVQCCHCGCHFPYTSRTSKGRGYCLSCKALWCGAPACAHCHHHKKKLDEYEKGLRSSL